MGAAHAKPIRLCHAQCRLDSPVSFFLMVYDSSSSRDERSFFEQAGELDASKAGGEHRGEPHASKAGGEGKW
jgi:hypothetical protein